MTLDLDGKTAIVTGAASGIGRATAERFAAEGANVVVADVVVDGAEETADQIESDGGTAHVVEVDVTNSTQLEALVEETVEVYGSLDIAHNNAGIEGESVPTTEQSEEGWDRVIDINLKGVWLGLKHEIPAMIETGGGSIVNTSSIAGLSAVGPAAYTASKHGVIGLTRVAATEYAQEDIRVNAVCPGVIGTEMVQRSEEESSEQLEKFVQMQPLGRMGAPEEISNAVVWLASEEASFVTGNAYPVEGGYTAL
jgi:NAD(P)-dependent dehydrogenase (short-subunit alcohol dehydrogenase family)